MNTNTLNFGQRYRRTLECFICTWTTNDSPIPLVRLGNVFGFHWLWAIIVENSCNSKSRFTNITSRGGISWDVIHGRASHWCDVFTGIITMWWHHGHSNSGTKCSINHNLINSHRVVPVPHKLVAVIVAEPTWIDEALHEPLCRYHRYVQLLSLVQDWFGTGRVCDDQVAFKRWSCGIYQK